jgi:hypothetical protein
VGWSVVGSRNIIRDIEEENVLQQHLGFFFFLASAKNRTNRGPWMKELNIPNPLNVQFLVFKGEISHCSFCLTELKLPEISFFRDIM